MTDSMMKVGTVRPMKTQNVTVSIAEDMVNYAAEIATTIVVQKYGAAIGCTRDQILEVNTVGLMAALTKAIDAEAKLPAGIFVPVYFDSMIRGLRCKLGRTVLETQPITFSVSPSVAYRSTVTLMKAVGIGFGKPHAPALDSSDTLALGIDTIDGVTCIVGNLNEVSIEDMIRRAFLDLPDKDLEMIAALAGELSLNYGELDNLLEEYYIAQVKVALT